MQQQDYDYFFVLDFEATCKEGSKIPKQEIIEFPVLKVDGRTFDVSETFHEYVRPVHYPFLTDFCTKLTGITQDMVEESEEFPRVLSKFLEWMEGCVGVDKKFSLVTCGDWDLKQMLPEQCKLDGLAIPQFCQSWINVKKSYADHTGVFVKGMMPMLKELKIPHVGRHHSGIGNCTNIAKVLKAMAQSGYVFVATSERICKSKPSSARSSTVQELPASRDSFSSVLKNLDNDRDLGSGLQSKKKRSHKSKKSSGSQQDQFEYVPAVKACKLQKTPGLAVIIEVLKTHKNYFRGSEVEELSTLCAAAKYFHLMENDDSDLFKKRLLFYYEALPSEMRIIEAETTLPPSSRDGDSITAEEPDEGEWKENVSKRSKRHKRKSKKEALQQGFVFV